MWRREDKTRWMKKKGGAVDTSEGNGTVDGGRGMGGMTLEMQWFVEDKVRSCWKRKARRCRHCEAWMTATIDASGLLIDLIQVSFGIRWCYGD
jgi:hypothetical protein